MRIFTIALLCLLLTACLDIFLYRESYSLNRMAYWQNLNNQQKATREVLDNCFALTKKDISGEQYAQCLYRKGYRFRTDSWLYCYHNKDICEIYDKYRN